LPRGALPGAADQRVRGGSLASQTGCRYSPTPHHGRLTPVRVRRTAPAEAEWPRQKLAAVTSDCSHGGVAAEVATVQTPSMPPIDLGKFAPVTLGNMRSQGCRELLAYCKSDGCKHSAIVSVGHLPDGTPIRLLGDGVVCSRCGHIGANVLPNWRAQYGSVNAEFHAFSLGSGPWKTER
jgi:hypothetical protein